MKNRKPIEAVAAAVACVAALRRCGWLRCALLIWVIVLASATPLGASTLSHGSPWTYYIFYDGDLEINPGPSTYISGDVFANGNLYVGASSGVVTFKGVVSAAKTITVGASPNDPTVGRLHTQPIFQAGADAGEPGVPREEPANVKAANLNAGSKPSTDKIFTTPGTSTNTNNASYHEFIDPPKLANNPDPTKPDIAVDTTVADPFSPAGQYAQRYYNEANYKVTIYYPNNNKANTPAILVTDNSNIPIATTDPIYTAFQSIVTISTATTSTTPSTSNSCIADAREGMTVALNTIDVSQLTSKVTTGTPTSTTPLTTTTKGLIIYLRDVRPASTGNTVNPAFRLKNGGVLPPYGLTIVSQNMVYVHGNYNTGSTTTQPPSNNSPTGGVTGVGASTVVATAGNQPNFGWAVNGNYWQPAAIVADAVNVLSRAWVDGNAESTVALTTTINAGIMAGNVPDVLSGTNPPQTYSGGIENFVRFHENWSGVRLSYFGSMVCLFQSTQATGPWSKAVYSAPDRYWNFDYNLGLSHLPPGVLLVSNPPPATTGTAVNVTYQAATLTGTANPSGLATTCYFRYGLYSNGTAAYSGTTGAQSVGSGTCAAAFSTVVTGLASASAYHFQLMSTNSNGTVYGDDQIFVTANPPPAVITGTATGTVYNAATLKGTVNPNGLETTYYFQYGLSVAYSGTTGAQSVGSGTSTTPLSVSITGLNPASTYHFQLVAANTSGTSYGSDQTFSTANLPLPVITSSSSAYGTYGMAFLYQITASNQPTGYSASGLPAGLNLDGSTGLITGTLAASGTFNVLLSASNTGGFGPQFTLALYSQNSYVAWQSQCFSFLDLADPAIGGDTATPASDGISNLMKYALYLPPKTYAVNGRPVAGYVTQNGNSYLTLSYTQLIAAPDIVYTAEVSGDLQAWDSGASATAPVSVTDSGDGVTQTVVVQDLTPVSSTAPRFMRLRVTKP